MVSNENVAVSLSFWVSGPQVFTATSCIGYPAWVLWNAACQQGVGVFLVAQEKSSSCSLILLFLLLLLLLTTLRHINNPNADRYAPYIEHWYFKHETYFSMEGELCKTDCLNFVILLFSCVVSMYCLYCTHLDICLLWPPAICVWEVSLVIPINCAVLTMCDSELQPFKALQQLHMYACSDVCSFDKPTCWTQSGKCYDLNLHAGVIDPILLITKLWLIIIYRDTIAKLQITCTDSNVGFKESPVWGV